MIAAALARLLPSQRGNDWRRAIWRQSPRDSRHAMTINPAAVAQGLCLSSTMIVTSAEALSRGAVRTSATAVSGGKSSFHLPDLKATIAAFSAV
jgi:hypothetical protein